MADESDDCFSNTLRCVAHVSRGPKLFSVLARGGIVLSSTSDRGKKRGDKRV